MKRLWTLGIIIVLWLVFSSPYLFKGMLPFPSDYLVSFFAPWNTENGLPVKNNAMPDVITQIFPWKKLTIETWKNGAIPLWNPYSFSGTTHAANYQSAVFSPVNVLFFVFPFLTAWTLMILLQPLVAGIGSYVFLRSNALSPWASILGSIGFMFCNFMTTWMAYGTLGWAIAFLPWALWAAQKFFDTRMSRYGVLVAIFIASSFLSGHFQISLYLFAAVIGYILFLSFMRGSASSGIWITIYALLGLLLSAPQFLLTYDAYTLSTRTTDVGKIEVIPWQYLITTLIPDFFGNPVTRNDWFGHYAEWGAYIGVIPLLLGLFAIVRSIKGQRLFFILLAFCSLVLAYPTPLNDLLYALNIPILSTSASGRIIVLLSFALSMLAAFGLDDVLDIWKSNKPKRLYVFVFIAAFIIGLIWVMLFFGNILPADKLGIAKRNSLLPTLIAGVALVGLLAGLWKREVAKYLAIGTFIVLVCFDSLRFVTKWMPRGDRTHMYPPVASLEFLHSKIGYDRVFGNIGNEASGVFSLPSIEGYDAMYQGRYAEFLNASQTGTVAPGGRSVVQFGKQGKYKTDIFKLLGIRYIYHRASDGRSVWTFPYWEYQEKGEMKIIFNDEKYQIYEFNQAYPRAFLASSYVVITRDQEIVDTLFDESFNSRDTLVLEMTPSIEPASGAGEATIISYTPNSVVIDVQTDVPKLLFLSDVFDPGWKAFVDGKETMVYRADYDFRAIALEAGHHVVEFTYIPDKLKIGFVLTSVAGILLLLSLFKKKI